jgi:GNAT superfamily N-acetyltransferase
VAVEVRAARLGDGAGLARVWLDNARYYVGLFPEDFRIPDEDGLDQWFETSLARAPSSSEQHLVAVVDGSVVAFASARLIDPDEHGARQMLADHPHRRAYVNALGTADAFQRQGIATQLVEALEAWAREQGARSIAATTYGGSPVSVPFWEQRMGYRPVGVTLTKHLS